MEENNFSLPVWRSEIKNPFEDENNCQSIEGAYQQVLDVFLQRHTDADRVILDEAFNLARSAHDAQHRKSGEPYLFHPLAVAKSLAEWNLDTVSLVCGMLHDVVEDTSIAQEEVAERFGVEVGEIIEGLTKLSRLEFQDRAWLSAENIKKLIVAMGKDVRVLLVKLADRLHNMRTLGAMREEKRRRIAHETIELYSPLAHRLGMGCVYMELEDLAFETLEPENYEALSEAIQTKVQNNNMYAKDIQLTLENLLAANGVKAMVSGRLKNLYSIWRIIGAQKMELDRISDWLTYRIICPDRASCYAALGIAHALYKPIPGSFKDHISLPKDNSYQSIHTSALMQTGDSFGILIRTKEMHEYAEYGIVSRWTYKEGRLVNRHELNQVAFLRHMAEMYTDVQDDRDLIVNLKKELTLSQMQVFTPNGELKNLPEGSTPVDFAYSIHTEVGHHCVGARVNGRLVQLRYALKSGDRVEIMTDSDRKPEREWLTFVKSAMARSKIQSFIREEERHQAIEAGKERLIREASTLGLNLEMPENKNILELRLEELKLNDWETFYAAAGFNRVPIRHLLEPILPDEARNQGNKTANVDLPETIEVDGTNGAFFIMAQCCKPILGDEIVGYTARGRGINIHRTVCPRLNSSVMPAERRVSVAWGKCGRDAFDVEIRVDAADQLGIVAEVSNELKQADISIQHLYVFTNNEGGAVFHIAMRVKDREHLVEIMGKIRQSHGVNAVERVRGSVFNRKRLR